MKFIGSATELLDELMGLPEDDEMTPIKKAVNPKPKKAQPKTRVPVRNLVSKPTTPTSKPLAPAPTQTENERVQVQPELEFSIPFQNCPTCSATIPLVDKHNSLKFQALYLQLQLTCQACSVTFCSLCSEQHEIPCYISCSYIVHRIIRHLTKLILSYTPAKATTNYNNYMPKGTGFGTGSSSTVINQAEIKKKTKQVDSHVATLFKTFTEAITLAWEAQKSTDDERSEDEAQNEELQDETTPEVPCMYEVLRSSKFVPILLYFLRNDSFFDMNERRNLYASLFTLIDKVAEDETVKNELLRGRERESVASLIAKMNSKAKFVSSSPALHLSGVSTLTSAVKNLHAMMEIISIPKVASPLKDDLVVIEKEEITPSTITPTAMENVPQFFSFKEFENPPAPENSQPQPQPQTPTKGYVETMQDHQFGELTMVFPNTNPQHPFRHYHLNQITSAKNQLLPEGIQRVCLELQSLCSQDFICEAGKTSILVRFDPENLSALRVLITGPPDTPYAYGCFIFDIFLPASYPKVPPLVQLVTTGYGAVRFNPNLYNCGKVCLSLLGTWSGSAEEKWNPEISTISQVLLSLQSLVLVAEPYFNEPGYQSSFGTDHGRANSESYNANIVKQTLTFAILEHLKVPPYGFEQAVRDHIVFNKKAILEIAASKPGLFPGFPDVLEKLLEETK